MSVNTTHVTDRNLMPCNMMQRQAAFTPFLSHQLLRSQDSCQQSETEEIADVRVRIWLFNEGMQSLD